MKIERLLKKDGEVAKNTRENIESKLGESIITSDNSLSYKYIEGTKMLK